MEKKMFECVCGKKYSSPPALCVHRKKCYIHLEEKNKKFKNIKEEENNSNRLILELENQLKFKDLEMENQNLKLQLKNKEIENMNLKLELKDLEIKLLTKFQQVQQI